MDEATEIFKRHYRESRGYDMPDYVPSSPRYSFAISAIREALGERDKIVDECVEVLKKNAYETDDGFYSGLVVTESTILSLPALMKKK